VGWCVGNQLKATVQVPGARALEAHGPGSALTGDLPPGVVARPPGADPIRAALSKIPARTELGVAKQGAKQKLIFARCDLRAANDRAPAIRLSTLQNVCSAPATTLSQQPAVATSFRTSGLAWAKQFSADASFAICSATDARTSPQ